MGAAKVLREAKGDLHADLFLVRAGSQSPIHLSSMSLSRGGERCQPGG